MDKEIIESLKQIRKHSAIKRAFSSYSLSICESLIANPTLIAKTCNEYGITPKELLIIITKEDISNLSFLDEIMAYTSKEKSNEHTSMFSEAESNSKLK